jgi:hypothetical protein
MSLKFYSDDYTLCSARKPRFWGQQLIRCTAYLKKLVLAQHHPSFESAACSSPWSPDLARIQRP